MKKYYLVVFCALLLFVVVGCSKKNQVVCSATVEESGMKMDAEVIGELDENDKIKDVTIVYDLKEKSAADQYCSLFKMFATEESGIKVDCSGTKVTLSGLKSMDVEDDSENLIGKTKDEFIAAAQSEEDIKFTCK